MELNDEARHREEEIAKIAAQADRARGVISLMSKDDILGTPDRIYRTVELTRWWGKDAQGRPRGVRVQSLTAGERDDWEAGSVVNKKDGTQVVQIRTVRAGLVARSVVDEKGTLVFSSDEVMLLQAKNAAAIDAIFQACREMNSITDEDIEEIVKNSGSGPGAAR